MAYRSEIARALDEMASDETGMKFQGLAVVHGQKKWPQLVACERKWDGGLDAHANGALQPDGKRQPLSRPIVGRWSGKTQPSRFPRRQRAAER